MENTYPTCVMQVVTVRLKDSAKRSLSFEAHERTTNWLSYWTPKANFKAVMAYSSGEALQRLKTMLKTDLVPAWLAGESGVKPSHFEFEVSEQTISDGMFWMPSGTVWCKWHSIEE